MTSRPAVLGIQRPPQRTLSGGVNRVPSRGLPPVSAPALFNPFAAPISTSQSQSQSQVYVDLTSEDGPVTNDAAAAQDRHTLKRKADFGEGPSTVQPSLQYDSPADGGRPAGLERTQSAYLERNTSWSAESLSDEATDTAEVSGPSGTLLPFPPRPGCLPPIAKKKYIGHVPAGYGLGDGKEDTSRALNSKPPADATRLSNGKVADFYPWQGNHAEDVLSEQTVKHGVYVDKSAIHVETNTAKPSLWSHLKNKSGLQNLSALFVQAMERRQARGKLTAPSTFKPPPRVILPDKKREDWLKDLALPGTPLRKLSRTIPHGIRGKVLLDQCLSKSIPTARAVWLAKCVGANELRQSKRQAIGGAFAMGGESKWVREWTTNVEQFVDETIASCGQPEWKANMNYAIRLASHLYSDRLMDQEHYLSWMLGSLEGSSLDRLPVWLVICQIYWKDLACTRRRGRRLAEALLSHLHNIMSEEFTEPFQPLAHRLNQMVNVLMASYRGCLILPDTWEKYLPVLESVAKEAKPTPSVRALQILKRRNERLLRLRSDTSEAALSSRKELLAVLDTIDSSWSVDALSETCIRKIPDWQDLISTLFKWACSAHRYGQDRIYIAARLLRKWNSMGIDTDTVIIAFFATSFDSNAFSEQYAYRIVAELVRSKQFSVARYIQSLISTGALSGSGVGAKLHPRVRLLAEIPFHGLPEHVANLRATVFSGTGLASASEFDAVTCTKRYIQQQIPNICGAVVDGPVPQDIATCLTSTAIKLEVSRWLRQALAMNTLVESSQETETKAKQSSQSYKTCVITESQFCFVRSILEMTEDYSILADVLGISAQSQDQTVLASVADTLNMHSRVLAGVGALAPLVKMVMERYSNIRMTKPPDRVLLQTLISLGTCGLIEQPRLQRLRYDLARCDQTATVAACSPVSDNMVEVLQTGRLGFEEEIEKIFASGNSMDEQTLIRLFHKIVSKLDAEISTDAESNNSFGFWLYRLRSFDEKNFDNLANEWMSGLLFHGDRKKINTAVVALVGSGCSTVENAVTCGLKCLQALKGKTIGLQMRVWLELLHMIFPSAVSPASLARSQERYRTELGRKNYAASHGTEVMQFLRKAIEVAAQDKDVTSTSALQGLLSSPSVINMLKGLVVKDMDSFLASPGNTGPQTDPRVTRMLKGVFDNLVDPAHTLALDSKPFEEQVFLVSQIADDLSLPFCQLELQLLYDMAKASGQESIAGAFYEAIKDKIDSDSGNWPDLIRILDKEVALKIREHAESRILSDTPNLLSLTDPAMSITETEALLHKYLAVIDITAANMTPGSNTKSAVLIVDKLRLLTETINGLEDDSIPSAKGQNDPIANVCPWIHALLHLALVHRGSFSPTKTSNGEATSLLTAICSLMLHPKLQLQSHTLEYLFDTAATFTDDVSDESRLALARSFTSRQPLAPPDSRITFLFGNPNPPDNWLLLVSTSAPAPTQSTPQQSQQSTRPNHYAFQQTQNSLPPRSHTPLPSPNLPQNQVQVNAQVAAMRHAQLQSQQRQQQTPQQSSQQQQQQQQQRQVQMPQQQTLEIRTQPFALKRWELLQDPTPVVGENDTAISLSLFNVRKVL